MGSAVSKQQIGERVKSAQKELEEKSTKEEEQYEQLMKQSPETLTNMVQSIEEALLSFSPFPESTLSLAFKANPERVTKALTKCTQKVLTAPIQKERYQWFMRYVFTSTVWFKKSENGHYLFEEMMDITNAKQEKIIQNMDRVYEHLTVHSKWNDITSIQNQNAINRQDDDAVGLLQEQGIRDIIDSKDSADGDDDVDIDALKTFIDNNLAVNILMTTAKKIDNEFQNEMDTILSRHGEFKSGPMKKVERALSKLENDYMNEEYPKAAKLLDIVRCSVSYNTAGQLLDGYKAFMSHIESGSSSLTLARVKNGFLDEADGGYRDIKVNVVYHSTLNPNLKMICEVQFILNQYLNEKKKVHKLYSIAREKTYFDLVVQKEEDEVNQRKQLKALKFEPVFKVRDDVDLGDGRYLKKCSIDSDLGLLGLNGGSIDIPDSFYCVNIWSKKLVFKHPAIGDYSHHWITINDQKYLSLQTTKNTINMFRVSDDHQFAKDESMKIVLDDDDTINYCEYDQSFDHIYIVRNHSILEKRALKDSGSVSMSIELESKISRSVSKSLSLSNDGKFCVIAGGTKDFFYIINLETKEQSKFITQKLRKQVRAPCFINGDSNMVAVGGYTFEGIEIWNLVEQKMVHHIEQTEQCYVASMYSANGILAVGFGSQISKYLQLYDVSSWSTIYRYDFGISSYSLFLTPDNQYLAAGGNGGEKAVVLKIE